MFFSSRWAFPTSSHFSSWGWLCSHSRASGTSAVTWSSDVLGCFLFCITLRMQCDSITTLNHTRRRKASPVPKLWQIWKTESVINGDGEGEIQVIYHNFSFLIFSHAKLLVFFASGDLGQCLPFQWPIYLGSFAVFCCCRRGSCVLGPWFYVEKRAVMKKSCSRLLFYFACILILVILVAHLWFVTTDTNKQIDAQTNKQANKRTSNEMGGNCIKVRWIRKTKQSFLDNDRCMSCHAASVIAS